MWIFMKFAELVDCGSEEIWLQFGSDRFGSEPNLLYLHAVHMLLMIITLRLFDCDVSDVWTTS